ncbi:hypothetical protein J4G37_58550, partial [Microvirga sp. 3-52]|nr:hypothetical protein [Microvirga sp. 3-52]
QDAILETEATVEESYEEETNQINEEIKSDPEPVENKFTLDTTDVATSVEKQHQDSMEFSGIEEDAHFIDTEKEAIVEEEVELSLDKPDESNKVDTQPILESTQE